MDLTVSRFKQSASIALRPWAPFAPRCQPSRLRTHPDQTCISTIRASRAARKTERNAILISEISELHKRLLKIEDIDSLVKDSRASERSKFKVALRVAKVVENKTSANEPELLLCFANLIFLATQQNLDLPREFALDKLEITEASESLLAATKQRIFLAVVCLELQHIERPFKDLIANTNAELRKFVMKDDFTGAKQEATIRRMIQESWNTLNRSSAERRWTEDALHLLNHCLDVVHEARAQIDVISRLRDLPPSTFGTL